MANEWFFKWHYIGRESSVEIDGFDGRKISYGGIKFDGTARDVYWSTLARYLKLKNGETFDKLEAELRAYPGSRVASAIADTQALMDSFTRQIIQMALEKDRVLRGNGIEFPAIDNGQASGLMIFADIEHRAKALRDFHRTENSYRRMENFLREYSELTKVIISLGVGSMLTFLIQFVGSWIFAR